MYKALSIRMVGSKDCFSGWYLWAYEKLLEAK